jgi:hypothetical protein
MLLPITRFPRHAALALSLLTAALIVSAACSRAAEPATQPAATQSTAAGAAPAVVKLLDQVEQKAATVKSLTAGVVYTRIQGLLGDKQVRVGTLIYQSGPPGRFSMHFTKLLVDNRADVQNRWYLFDGTWFVERLEDQVPKQFFKRQIVGPGVSPAQADPLAVGGGPFPLPVNMKRAVVLQRFVATLVPTTAADPLSTQHLRLVPRPGQRTEWSQMDTWYNADLLPVKVETQGQAKSESKSIYEFSEIKLNPDNAIDDKAFDTTEPTAPGWEIHVTPWEQR